MWKAGSSHDRRSSIVNRRSAIVRSDRLMSILNSLESEYRRYKGLGEGAVAQLDDADFSKPAGGGNSIAILVWHISGNLKSRFSDFLTSDGEKPWRARDEAFIVRSVTPAQLLEKRKDGWRV